MRGGKLDRRIIIQQKTESTDSYGQRTLTWATYSTVWANTMEMLGKEDDDSNNRSTKREVQFRIRYNSNFTNEMRVIWESEYYKIEDIKELGRRDGMILKTMLLTQT